MLAAQEGYTTTDHLDPDFDPILEQLTDEFTFALAAMRQAESDYRAALLEHFEGLRTEASTDREYLRYRDARRRTEELGRSVTHYDGGLRVARALAGGR